MKNTLILLILASFNINVLAALDADLVVNETELDGEKGFFDPHNHTGGVLPPLALVDIKKFLAGQEPTLFDLEDFWKKMVELFHREKAFKGPRVSEGTQMLFLCDEPKTMCKNEKGEACMDSLLNNINNILTATPLTDFATAYAVRGQVKNIKSTTPAEDSQAIVLSLAQKKVALVEMSFSFIGGTDKISTRIFAEYKKLYDDLISENTSSANQKLKNTFTKLGLKPPVMKWLLMMHTTELGQISDEETLTYDANGTCEAMPMPENLITDPKQGLQKVLTKNEDIVGIDIAGPEKTCFADFGMDKFKELAKTTYFAAKSRNKKSHQGKLVVRVHVGEGFPLREFNFSDDPEKACAEIKQFPKVKHEKIDEKSTPVHYQKARDNLALLLDAIKDLKSTYNDIDDHIIFRLGHATHMTSELAEIAKKLNVTADVNLSSNISTGATNIDYGLIEQALVNNAIGADQIRSLKESLLKEEVPAGKIFEGHGLKWLLYHGVPTMLGSDGAGVEHSGSMTEEYKTAADLIEYWNNTDESFKEKNVSINSMLEAQKVHFDEMGY